MASQFNEQFTDALVENTIDEIAEIMPQAQVDLIRVPGAFEIPVVVKSLLEEEEPQCIIALGVIIRGSTSHADLVGGCVTEALQNLAVEHTTPIIHEVLLLDDEKQAYARCIGSKLNRGREAARSAATIIEVMEEITRSNKSLRLHPSNV